MAIQTHMEQHSNPLLCAIMAIISSATTLTGAYLPKMYAIAEFATPFLQDIAFAVAITSGYIAIKNGRLKKKK